MKIHSSLFKIILLLILCSTLNSCLSIDRKIKINKDGSGEETMKITFMKEFYSMMGAMSSLMDSTRREAFMDSLYNDQVFINKTREGYDSIHGVKITDIYTEKGVDSSNSFIIKYTFDSLNKLAASLENTIEDNDEKKLPTIVTMINENGNVVFNYTYLQPAAEEANDSLAEQMKTGMMKMFGNGNISFEIEFPYEVTSSNATSTTGNTLTWSYPMSEVIMTSKMSLEAVMKE